MKKFYVVIPANINFKELIDRDPIKYEKIDLNIVKGILGQVTKFLTMSLEIDDFSRKSLSRFRVYLSATELKSLYGNGYKLALDFLHREVLFKHPYSKDISFSFSFNPEILKGDFKIDAIEGNSKSSRTIIKKLIDKGNKIDPKTKKKFKFLIKFFDSNRLKIDSKSAYQYILNEFTSDGNKKSFISRCQKLVNIMNGCYNITNNPKTDGRFHNNFVRLKKELRQFLTYDGKPLVEIDISNSIPYILSSILNSSLTIDQVNPDTKSIYSSILYKFHKNRKSLDIAEIQQFHNLCANGNIYQSLIPEYFKNTIELESSGINEDGTELFIQSKEYRKTIKTKLLSMIFARNKHYKYMQEVLNRSYPTITKFINKMKRKHYERLSHFLFQIESFVMLEKVARGFNKKQRGRTPIFTIHDCIVTTEDNASELYNYVKETFKEIFKNKQPQLKLELWQKNYTQVI